MVQKHSSVSTVFAENRTFLMKFISRYFSDTYDIEDVVQETYLRAYEAEGKRKIDSPKSFLFKIAKNVALTKLTKKSNQINKYIEEVSGSSVLALDTAPSTDLELIAKEKLGLYCEAVATLSEKCREVYLLRKVYGLSHKEIATRMSLSVSSAEKYLRQGILECEAYISKHENPTVMRDVGGLSK